MISSARTVEIAPKPIALVSSLRGLGYSPETAIADLIDNSITAGARTVEIDIQWNDGSPQVALLDDGGGMNAGRLADAMRFGGHGSEGERHENDLGRFGMGMKTASLSQCRQLTVISSADGIVHGLALDIDVIAKRGWLAIVVDQLPDHPFISTLQGMKSGTVLVLNGIDELSGLAGLTKDAFYLRLEDIRAHLGMVFHRFINGDAAKLSILLNTRAVKAWDPFQTGHPATREMPTERIRHAGASFTVKPYVLPHRDRYANDTEYEAAGGPGGWGARQGFYVYRGKRLLVAGSWLGLGGVRTWAREESSRLARIEVDLPTNLDRDWRIDVRKSQARPPGALRARLTAIAHRCRRDAREVFAFRGQGPRTRGAPKTTPAIWLASQGPKGKLYRINRDHPVIMACRSSLGAKKFDGLLSIVERSVPVERIWLEVSEAEGAHVPTFDKEEILQLVDHLAELGGILPSTLTLEQRVDALLLNLPGDLTQLRSRLTESLGSGNG